ncbi:unnamed protein product [Effrenium voratum]|nr:unnamed protein product [Effrenium voratum]
MVDFAWLAAAAIATSWPTPSLPWWRYCGTSHMCTFSTLPPSNGHIRSRQVHSRQLLMPMRQRTRCWALVGFSGAEVTIARPTTLPFL